MNILCPTALLKLSRALGSPEDLINLQSDSAGLGQSPRLFLTNSWASQAFDSRFIVRSKDVLLPSRLVNILSHLLVYLWV